MRKVLTDGGPGTEYWQEFENFRHSAWRWEQQPAYWMGYEREQFDKFLAGEPEAPTANKDLGDWMRQVSAHVKAGRTVGRVRVVETPPTDYQRWMQWMDRWNRDAGEDILYLTRQGARDAGIIPAIGPDDWWLFDDRRLVVTRHDDQGRRIEAEAYEDEPEVEQALRWRERAIAAARQESSSRSSAAPPVVLIAQVGTGGDSWKPVVDRLGGVTCFTYDRPGTGNAPERPAPNPPLPHSAFARELEALLEEAGIAEPAVIVGHSFGGNIARVYGGAHPERVAGMVFVDSSIPQTFLVPSREPSVDGDSPGATTIDTVAGQVEILASELPNVPTVVLVCGRSVWEGSAPHDAVDDLWLVSQRMLARQANAALIVADNVGHQIPRDAPDLVAYAIAAVVQAVRTSQTLALDPERLTSLGGHVDS